MLMTGLKLRVFVCHTAAVMVSSWLRPHWPLWPPLSSFDLALLDTVSGSIGRSDVV